MGWCNEFSNEVIALIGHFRPRLSCLSGTWRSDEARRGATPGEKPLPTMAKGKLVRYLDPVAREAEPPQKALPHPTVRVIDRPDIQALKMGQIALAF